MCVRAINSVALAGPSACAQLMPDGTPPLAGTVLDSADGLTEASFFGSWRAIGIAWRDFVERESAIAGYSVCLGSQHGSCNIASFVDVGLAQSHVFDATLLLSFNANGTATLADGSELKQTGAVVFATVAATNVIGLDRKSTRLNSSHT